MIDKLECTEIGILIKSHGITGEVAIMLREGFYSDQIETNFLFLDVDGGLVPFKVKSIRDKNDEVLLVKFVSYSDEKMVQPFIGSSVWMKSNELIQAEEEIGVGMLVGYKVTEETHGDIGEIVEIRDLDKNPLFVINGEKDEILIPIVDEFIININEDKKIVELKTPEGLLDLYM